MATAFMSGKMEIGMRVSGISLCDTVKDLMFLQTAMYSWVNITMDEQKVTDSIGGLMAIFTVECL